MQEYTSLILNDISVRPTRPLAMCTCDDKELIIKKFNEPDESMYLLVETRFGLIPKIEGLILDVMDVALKNLWNYTPGGTGNKDNGNV